MTQQSHSFLQPSLGNLPLDMSIIEKKQPLLYTNSSTKVDQYELESEIIKEKYQKEYNKFYKSLHQRSRSQVEKLDRIIQDASDLNQILCDAGSWLQKKSKKEPEFDNQNLKQPSQIAIPLVKWGRSTRRQHC